MLTRSILVSLTPSQGHSLQWPAKGYDRPLSSARVERHGVKALASKESEYFSDHEVTLGAVTFISPCQLTKNEQQHQKATTHGCRETVPPVTCASHSVVHHEKELWPISFDVHKDESKWKKTRDLREMDCTTPPLFI